jgi:predicted ATPase
MVPHVACGGLLGRTTEGLSYLTEAEQITETTNDAFHEAESHRVRGDLLNATGDRAAAEQSYRQAPAVAQRQSAKLFELRAALDLARLWRDQGKRTEARDLLAPIYGGSPKVSTRRSCKTPRRYWTSWRDQFHPCFFRGDPRFCHVPSVAACRAPT